MLTEVFIRLADAATGATRVRRRHTARSPSVAARRCRCATPAGSRSFVPSPIAASSATSVHRISAASVSPRCTRGSSTYGMRSSASRMWSKRGADRPAEVSAGSGDSLSHCAWGREYTANGLSSTMWMLSQSPVTGEQCRPKLICRYPTPRCAAVNAHIALPGTPQSLATSHGGIRRHRHEDVGCLRDHRLTGSGLQHDLELLTELESSPGSW